MKNGIARKAEMTCKIILFKLTIVSCLLLLHFNHASAVNTESWLFWQGGNIQLLRGNQYKLGDAERNIITVEYANAWRYGDVFFFVDGSHYDDDNNTAYGEFSPRFSLSRIFNKELTSGLVQDVLISTTFEKGENSVRAVLIGMAADLNIPGFRFFKTNLYNRHNPNLDEDTWQVTLSWQYPIQFGNTNFITEGFADFAGDAGITYHNNQLIVPRLLLDLGDILGNTPNKLWIGIEYSYWNNKFGIDGVTESVPQLQLKCNL